MSGYDPDEGPYAKLAREIAVAQPAADPPPGFTMVARTDPYESLVGPFFFRETPDPASDRFTMSFYVDDRHVNARGVLHGGMLMTFADSVLGSMVWQTIKDHQFVTLSLNGDFLRSASIGDLVVCEAEIVRRTNAIVFTRGEFKVNESLIFTARAVWKVLGRT